MTNNSLTMDGDPQLDHGEFTDHFSPPPTIIPDQLAEWRAESGGDIPIIGAIGTGTEGEVNYRVDGPGDKVTLQWDNPAVGNTFFGFTTANGNDGPSDFVFFYLHFAFNGAVEPPPGQLNPLIAVSQGDLDGAGLIFPLPAQEHIKPHAWFDIGLRNKREPVSIGRWLKALGEDPSQGLKAIFLGRRVSVKELIELH